MRPLTDEELRILFEKLQLFIDNSNLKKLINRNDQSYTFRMIKNRVYYLSEEQMKLSSNIAREKLLSIGTCLGKFLKNNKFILHITCLDYLSQYAQYKIWIKSNSELSFLYGNNITKAGLLRITDNIPKYSGVVVYNSNDIPLGFGIAAQPTEYCKDLEPTGIVVLHQADVGEYLRVEDNLF